VDEGQVTSLSVFTGKVRLFNETGDILVSAGESATVEPGKAPIKRKTIHLPKTPFMYLDLSMEWIEFLKIGDDSLPQVTAEDSVERAGRMYDAGRFEEAVRSLLQVSNTNLGDTEVKAFIRLISGLLALRAHRFVEAESHLLAANAGTSRVQQLSQLGRFSIAIETDQLSQAETILSTLEQRSNPIIEVGLARAWFEMLVGNYTAATHQLKNLKMLYPNEVRVWILYAQLHTLQGDIKAVAVSTEEALDLAPEYYLAWYWRALEGYKLIPDEEVALTAYARALELRPSYSAAWNDLAVLLNELGRNRQAQKAAEQAVSSDPNRASFHANHGAILGVAARRKEAELAFNRAFSLEPNEPGALRGMGVMQLEQGDTNTAIELLRKAEVVDPESNDSSVLLGIAEYQQGAVSDAWRTLQNASRTDPNDPVPSLALSVIAQDHAHADEAIRYARQSAESIVRTDTLITEGLASAQSGVLNVGSAYANLGMDVWGGYYGQRAYSPYSANSQFFLSNTYPSARAHDSLNLQGLLLDPTSVSNNLRYTQFIREPGNEVAFSTDASTTDGGDGWGLKTQLHGFTRLPTPLAYRFWGSQAEDDGFRSNSYQDTKSAGIAVGGWIDDANFFLARTQYTKDNAGLPGSIEVPDPDDQKNSEFFAAGLGFQHRIHAKNRVLGRLQWRSLNQRLSNPTARNLGLSDLDYSLISNFGLNTTRWMYSMGLYDATNSSINSVPERITLILGPAGEYSQDIWGVELPQLTDEIPSDIDLKPISVSKSDDHQWALQLRHLFETDDWDLTYGFETGRHKYTISNDFRDLNQTASGYITDARLEDAAEFDFIYGSPEFSYYSNNGGKTAGFAYIDGTWLTSPDLRIQLGAYLRYLDDDNESDRYRIDPRIGLAWQAADGHWLRTGAQRNLILVMPDTLAPVTLVGLVPTDDYALLPRYIPAGVSHYSTGSTVDDILLRWDAEWSSHLFTYAQFEHQEIDDYFQVIPWKSDWFLNQSTLHLNSVRIRQLLMGLNIWITGGIGIHAQYMHNWSCNLDSGEEDGKRVPLVPDNTLDFKVTHVHPRHIRIQVSVRYLGERWADKANHTRLDDTWLTDLSVNWQPKQRHWSLTASVIDLFDREPDVAAGVPAPGRAYLLSAAYRF
jgi:tetratricopeptide (TPR) repeat protein